MSPVRSVGIVLSVFIAGWCALTVVYGRRARRGIVGLLGRHRSDRPHRNGVRPACRAPVAALVVDAILMLLSFAALGGAISTAATRVLERTGRPDEARWHSFLLVLGLLAAALLLAVYSVDWS